MNDYRVPVEELNAILFEVLQAPAQLAALPDHADADEALMRQLLDEMGKFVSGQVAPLNRVGDDYIFSYSLDGIAFAKARMFYLQSYEEVKAGAYIAAPNGDNFCAELSGLNLGA